MPVPDNILAKPPTKVDLLASTQRPKIQQPGQGILQLDIKLRQLAIEPLKLIPHRLDSMGQDLPVTVVRLQLLEGRLDRLRHALDVRRDAGYQRQALVG